MNEILPPIKNSFQVNRPRSDGKAIPLLPSLDALANFAHGDFAPVNAGDYVHKLHSLIGDLKGIDNSIVEAAKALGAAVPSALPYAKISFLPDPANYGLMEWPGIQPESLRKIAQENLLPQMIIRSRVTDLRRYSQLSTHIWRPGWRVVMREASATPTRQDDRDIEAAENFVWNCSRDDVFSSPRDRDQGAISQFEDFLAGMADDTFTYDGWAIWTDRDYQGRIRKFCNLPAGMIRLALPGVGYKGNDELYAAMVAETGNVVASFTRDELTWCPRNIRNDPSVLDYGWSELEMAIRAVQGYQSAIDLNVDTFTRSSIPNGMLLLTGDFWQQEQIDALMREWTNMKRGITKVWGMPVMSVPDDGKVELLEFMKLKDTDVRYKDHMNMMVGIYCIMTQFPIRRLGMFASGGHKDNQPVQDESVEIAGVDDSGLPALLTFIENRINEYLLQPNWPRLRFQFMAKNPKEDAREYEALKLARTWGESRAEADLPKVKGPSWASKMLELMECCPEDPAKMGVFQTLAAEILKDELGLNEPEMQGAGGLPTKTPGAPFPSKKDPAASQAHGHRAGVRRPSSSKD